MYQVRIKFKEDLLNFQRPYFLNQDNQVYANYPGEVLEYFAHKTKGFSKIDRPDDKNLALFKATFESKEDAEAFLETIKKQKPRSNIKMCPGAKMPNLEKILGDAEIVEAA